MGKIDIIFKYILVIGISALLVGVCIIVWSVVIDIIKNHKNG